MKAILLAIALCCLLSIAFSETLDRPAFKPTNSATIKYDRMPRWIKEKMKSSKYLNQRKLPFKYVVDIAFRAKVEKCNWKDEDKEFYLSNNVTLTEKLGKYMPYCEFKNQFTELLKAQAGNTTEAINYLVQIYSEMGYLKLNRELRQETADEEIPYALALYDSIKHRMTPWGNGTLFRGTLCKADALKEKVGSIIEVDSFTSMSRSPSVAQNFKSRASNGLDACLITMDLEGDDWCGTDIQQMSSFKSEQEVLVPFSTRVRVQNIVPINDTNNVTTHYNVTWKCAEKLFEDEANSIEAPKGKASNMFSFDE